MQQNILGLFAATLVCLLAETSPAHAARRHPDGTLAETHGPKHGPKHRPAHRAHAIKAPSHIRPKDVPPQVPAERAEEVEKVEPIETVETVETVDVTPAAQPPAVHSEQSALAAPPARFGGALSAVQIAGHLHAAWVHLPIAWTLLWTGVEVLGPPLGLAPLQAAAWPLGIATVASFIPSVVSGLARLGELGDISGYDAGPALWHRNVMFVAAGVLLVALIFRLVWAVWKTTVVRRIYLACLIVAFGLMAYSAHLGGALVYGDDFLPF